MDSNTDAENCFEGFFLLDYYYVNVDCLLD